MPKGKRELDAPCEHKSAWNLERYSAQDECMYLVLWCLDCGALHDGTAWRLPANAERTQKRRGRA